MSHTNFIFIIFLVSIFMVSCEPYELKTEVLDTEHWETSLSLSSANSVIYHDTLYLFFGRDNEGSDRLPSNKVYYAYMDNLSDFKSFPLQIKPRVSATSLLVGDKLFMGLGFNGKVYNDTSILKDWWVYDFPQKKLTKLADFPFNDAVAPVSWYYDDNIYLALGFSNSFCRNVYKYSVVDDKWYLISNDSPMLVRGGAKGAIVGNNIYLGTGYRTSMTNDWWRYDFINNQWTECESLPSKGRIYSSVVSIGAKIYVLGGRYFGGTETCEHFYSNILVYDTASDAWTVLGDMPQGGTENMIAFEYKGYLYWGLGQQNGGVFSNNIYKYKIK